VLLGTCEHSTCLLYNNKNSKTPPQFTHVIIIIIIFHNVRQITYHFSENCTGSLGRIKMAGTTGIPDDNILKSNIEWPII
jgi:hypothetical protein